MDISKLRNGDTIMVELIFESREERDDPRLVCKSSVSTEDHFIWPENVKEIIPKVEVGTNFPHTLSSAAGGCWTVIAIHRNWAWCIHPCLAPNTFSITSIRDRLGS